MKKWIWIVSTIVVLLLGYIVYSAMAGIQVKKTAEEEATKFAIDKGGLISVDEFYLYHGSKTYSVVVGKSKDKTEYVLWIPEDLKKENVKKMKYASGYSKEEIIEKVKAEHNPHEIVTVKLGMKKDVPVWEVTVKDEKGGLTYIDYKFKK
ncbi:MAG: DUF5590 domain-containing protein [Bacillus sp. (in: firmicutes)]